MNMSNTYEVFKKSLGDGPTVRAALIKADSPEHAEQHFLESGILLGAYTYSHVAQVPDSEWTANAGKAIRMHARRTGADRQHVLFLADKFRAAHAADDKAVVTQTVSDLMSLGDRITVAEVWTEVTRDLSGAKDMDTARWYHEAFGSPLLEAVRALFAT